MNEAGSLWRHGDEEEAVCRVVALRLSTEVMPDVAIALVFEDSRPVEWLYCPAWSASEDLSIRLRNSGCKLPRCGLVSSPPRERRKRSKPRSFSESSENGPTSPSSCPEAEVYIVEHVRVTAGAITMTKIEVNIGATAEESLANAKAAIDAHFATLKQLSDKVVTTARGLFAKYKKEEDYFQVSLLQSAIVLELEMEKIKISGDMVIDILKAAGFVGAGVRGPKGIALPGHVDAPKPDAAPKQETIAQTNGNGGAKADAPKGGKDKPAQAAQAK